MYGRAFISAAEARRIEEREAYLKRIQRNREIVRMITETVSGCACALGMLAVLVIIIGMM